MNSKEIYNRLRVKFSDNKYLLENSYIFDWESDFYYKTSSGYNIEIEVKVSRSDFLADFKKTRKHKIMSLYFDNKRFILDKEFDTYKVSYEEGISETINGKRVWNESNKSWNKIPSGKVITRQVSTNNCIEKYLKGYFNVKYELLYCGINIKSLPNCPNRFSYICPSGLIKKEEIPEYAGLYYISDTGRITEVKRAPEIHKNKLDLNKILLDKFYYKSLNLENKLRLCTIQE